MNQIPGHSAEDLLAATPKAVTLMPMLLAIVRGKRLILVCGVVLAAAAWIFLRFFPNMYQSTVEIMPPQMPRANSAASLLSQTGLVSSDALSLNFFTSSIQAKTQADVFAVLLTAWPLQDNLIQRFDLKRAYSVRSDEAARRKLLSATTIKAGKDGFIRISIVDTDPRHAAAIANGYPVALRELLRNLALTEASQRRAFYESQLESVKVELIKAESAFKAMQQKSGMVSLDSQARSLLEGAAALRAQITSNEVQLQSLRGYSTAINPQVQIAETELAALRSQLAKLESKGQGGLIGKPLSGVPEAELNFIRASRELKYQEGLYDLIFKQYEGSRIDEARDAAVVQVIEPALVPTMHFGPHRVRDAAIAFLAGCFFGVILVVIRYERSKMSEESKMKWQEFRNAILRW